MQAGLATRRLTLRDIFLSLRRVISWLSDVRVFAALPKEGRSCGHVHASLGVTTLDDGSITPIHLAHPAWSTEGSNVVVAESGADG